MRGTWKVTGFSGATAVLGIAAAAAAVEGVMWVEAHILWILGTGALCAALTGVAVARLIRWSDAHAARIWAQRAASLTAEPVTPVAPPRRPAIASPQAVHFNFYGTDDTRAAAVIRQAIPGPAGDASTEEE